MIAGSLARVSLKFIAQAEGSASSPSSASSAKPQWCCAAASAAESLALAVGAVITKGSLTDSLRRQFFFSFLIPL